MILLKSLVGSRLHGLHNEQSDYDWKIINVSPLSHVLSPFRTLKGKDSVSPEEDNCTYEFTHFCKLFADCNPTILEMLWSNHFEELHPLGQELIEGRKKLLRADKIFYAYRGYAHDQRKKMSLDQPNTHRTAKAFIAYIRIMQQGIRLLGQGDFDPVYRDGNTRNLLLEIKNNFDPETHVSWATAYIEVLEKELQIAYDDCKLEFKPDLPWIENMIEKVYLELGRNEQPCITEERQQVSRCTN